MRFSYMRTRVLTACADRPSSAAKLVGRRWQLVKQCWKLVKQCWQLAKQCGKLAEQCGKLVKQSFKLVKQPFRLVKQCGSLVQQCYVILVCSLFYFCAIFNSPCLTVFRPFPRKRRNSARRKPRQFRSVSMRYEPLSPRFCHGKVLMTDH